MSFLKLFILSVLLIMVACNTPRSKSDEPIKSYELSGRWMKDTVNLVDANGFKQGIWVEHGSKDTMVYLNDTGHFTTTLTARETLRRLKKEGNKIVTVKRDSLK